MNNKLAVQVLKWTVAARADGTATSPYICDCVSKYKEYNTGHDGLELLAVVAAIRAEIANRIEYNFGVPEYLGLEHKERDGNYQPAVIAFREKLLADLILFYQDKV